MTNPIDNTEDVIDSRDVIARIEDLKSERDEWEEMKESGTVEGYESTTTWESDRPDDAEELRNLENLAEQAEGYGDWEHGETLIHRGHWEAYVQQYAEDIGAVNGDARWPNTHIDWEAAAKELEQDYMPVDFDGQEYLMRA